MSERLDVPDTTELPVHPAALLHGAVERQGALLEQLVEAVRGSAVQLAVSEAAQLPQLLAEFPFPGSSRWLLPRVASGGLFASPAAGALDLLAHNPNRLGATIVNGGAKAAILFLLDAASIGTGAGPGVGQLVLEPEGGSWDLRLGNLLWCGSVCARGETNLSVVEV